MNYAFFLMDKHIVGGIQSDWSSAICRHSFSDQYGLRRNYIKKIPNRKELHDSTKIFQRIAECFIQSESTVPLHAIVVTPVTTFH